MQEANHILQKYWGHQSFRPLQEEIIAGAVNKRDVLALLPTGGGKSLCFQIPSLLREGICIVVSPLVALIEDQIQTLQKKDIKALSITGGISFKDLDTLLDNCIYGNYKFLYLSPERLQQEIVQHRLKQMNVNLIAIDEAHCISQWGHDFRPAYLNISILRDLHPEVPIMALTATATKEVEEDIRKQLNLRNPLIFKDSLERKNLAFKVVFAENKIFSLRQILQNKEESAIVYVRSRQATIDITRELEHFGYNAAAYHGGLTKKDKSNKLDKWLMEKVKIMVATNAFGMGIDKANVRQVIHLNLPESIESYFQEAGRAGRDHLYATATLISHKRDLPQVRNQFFQRLPDLESTILVYKKLASYFLIAYGEGQDVSYDFNFAHFCTQYQLNSEKTFNTLQLLDRLSIIKLSQQYKKKIFVQILLTNKQLFSYLEENRAFEPTINAILRTYGGIFENKLPINLPLISKKAGCEEVRIFNILKTLFRDKIIDFEYQENDASLTFLVPREDETTIYPVSRYINNQIKNKIEKINAMLDYVNNNTVCRSRQLLYYFGAVNHQDCNICSVCQTTEKKIKKEIIKRIYLDIIKELEAGEKSSRQLVTILPFPEAGILKVLGLLLQKDIISLTLPNTYKLKHI